MPRARVLRRRALHGFTIGAPFVEGRVPGMSAAQFDAAATAAKDGCPISKALAGNVELSVKASLAG